MGSLVGLNFSVACGVLAASPGIKPVPLHWQAPAGPPGKAPQSLYLLGDRMRGFDILKHGQSSLLQFVFVSSTGIVPSH